MRATIYFIVIFAGLLLAQSSGYTVSRRSDTAVCHTQECRDAAAVILSNLDTNVDPCDDFYQYACGGWIKNNPIPKSSHWNSYFHLVAERIRIDLKDVLERDSINDRDSIKKAKIFYKACVDEETIDAIDVFSALDFIEELGGMPLLNKNLGYESFSLESYLARTKYDVNISPIIKLDVKVDDKNNSRYITALAQPTFIMKSASQYLSPAFNSTRTAHLEFLQDFLEQLWVGSHQGEIILDQNQQEIQESFDEGQIISTQNQQEIREAVSEIFQLEKRLAEVIVPDEQTMDILDKYNKMPIAEMSSQLSDEFDWLLYLRESFRTLDVQINDDTEVVVYATPYLNRFMDIINEYSPRVIRNYVVLASLVPRINALSKRLRDTEAAFRKVSTGVSEEKERWQDCVSHTDALFPMPVGALYVKKSFPEETKAKAYEMSDYIVKAIHENLETLEWMDSRTKSAALVKVNAVRKLIGYPDYIIDENDPTMDEQYQDAIVSEHEHFKNEVSVRRFHLIEELANLGNKVDPLTWVEPPGRANAYYAPSFNKMNLPAGILQAPFFSAARPFAMNYGGIGNAVAHEITHGLDITGSRYNEDGDLENWWSNASREHFEAAADCMRKQYSAYYYKVAGMYLNGNRTIRENIGDNGGIRGAYEAYQLWRGENPGREFQLPGLTDYTAEQLFFIASGQIFCAMERKEFAKQVITRYWHSPPIFRVTGYLQNFEKFGEAFGCQRGVDRMYPAEGDTCRVW